MDIPSVSGTANIIKKTNSDTLIIPAVISLYDHIVNPEYPVRRINLTCNRVTSCEEAEQLSLLETDDTTKNRTLQETVLRIKAKFGKNAVLKGMNFNEAATTRERNNQIGGHKANG